MKSHKFMNLCVFTKFLYYRGISYNNSNVDNSYKIDSSYLLWKERSKNWLNLIISFKISWNCSINSVLKNFMNQIFFTKTDWYFPRLRISTYLSSINEKKEVKKVDWILLYFFTERGSQPFLSKKILRKDFHLSFLASNLPKIENAPSLYKKWQKSREKNQSIKTFFLFKSI